MEKASKSRTRASSAVSKEKRSISQSITLKNTTPVNLRNSSISYGNKFQKSVVSTSGKFSNEMKNKRCFSVLSNDKKTETLDHFGTVVHQDQNRNGNGNSNDLTYIKKKKSYVTVL